MVIRNGFFVRFSLAVSAFFLAAIAFADRVFAALSPAFEQRFTFDGYDLSYAGGGEPLDPSVLQSLRHDAGMRRMSAARNV